MDIGIVPAFVAGLISFLSPCVLPLVPAYIGYLGGTAVTTVGTTERNSYVTFLHAIFFVLGFTAIFVLLGATASALGQLLNQQVYAIQRVGGVIVILFGLHMMGLFTALEQLSRLAELGDQGNATPRPKRVLAEPRTTFLLGHRRFDRFRLCRPLRWCV